MRRSRLPRRPGDRTSRAGAPGTGLEGAPALCASAARYSRGSSLETVARAVGVELRDAGVLGADVVLHRGAVRQVDLAGDEGGDHSAWSSIIRMLPPPVTLKKPERREPAEARRHHAAVEGEGWAAVHRRQGGFKERQVDVVAGGGDHRVEAARRAVREGHLALGHGGDAGLRRDPAQMNCAISR